MRIRTSRLPAGYREVEYLESATTQYIDTGITANSTSIISYTFQYVSLVGSYNRIFGARNGNGNGLLNQRTTSSSGGGFFLESAGGTWSTSSTDFDKHEMVLNGITQKLYNNGTQVLSSLVIADNTEGTMWLFGTNQGGTNSNVRFYSYSHIKGGVLVQKLIPCVRVGDSKPGMYDIVNGNFLVNQASGVDDFSVGSYVDAGYRVSTTLLPETYQEVEYITFSGTSGAGQFIRTGINTLTHPYSVKTIYNKTNTDNRDQTLVGQRQIGKYVNIYNTYYETIFANTASGTAPNNEKTTIEIKSGTGVLKNGEVIYSTTDTTTRTTQYELLIGAFSEDSYSNAKWFFNGNIYDIQIINNGKLYRHYVPCYRKSDNVIGMYDVVGHTFYTNDGSGSFTKGNDAHSVMKTTPKINLLPSEYQGVEYIYQEKQADSGTGNLAYIQSNLSFADVDEVEFDLSIASTGGSQNNIVLCAYNTSFYIIVDMNTHRVNGFSSSTWDPSSTTLFSDGKRHKVSVSGLSSSNTTAIRTAWDWTWWHETKWYGLKLFKSGKLIQNLIPCYRKSDNVIGMYDTIDGVFYTNSGSGTFLKGNDKNFII